MKHIKKKYLFEDIAEKKISDTTHSYKKIAYKKGDVTGK